MCIRDSDRVYQSDLKKLVQWYNILVAKGAFPLEAPETAEDKAEDGSAEEEKPAAKKPAAKKAAAKKTSAKKPAKKAAAKDA